MNFSYKYNVTTRSILEPWAIRSYLHSRGYNVLIILSKGLAVYRLINLGFTFNFDLVLSLVLFFYFELFIIYRYFYFKNQIKTLYGDNREREIQFFEDKIIFKDVNSSTEINVSEITSIKETKWFIFVYKAKKPIIYHYKNLMKKEDVDEIRRYYNSLNL